MKPEGYRYVREYRTKHGPRWALWQVVDGRRKRVGTAIAEADYRRFLQLEVTP